jgi:hypothetical protein
MSEEDHTPAEKVSPGAFVSEALAYAQQAHAATGVLVSVILAQWAVETAWGGWDWTVAHNPGNVGSFDGQPVNTFPTLEAGTLAYIQTIKLGYYNAVRAATSYTAQCTALGNSPWASGHYIGQGAFAFRGGILIEIIQQNGFTQYDGAAPAPGPTPAPTPTPLFEENEMIARDNVTGGCWVVRPNGNVYTFNGAQYIGPLPKYLAQWGIGTSAKPITGIVSDEAGGFILSADNPSEPTPAVYHITADAQYAH